MSKKPSTTNMSQSSNSFFNGKLKENSKITPSNANKKNISLSINQINSSSHHNSNNTLTSISNLPSSNQIQSQTNDSAYFPNKENSFKLNSLSTSHGHGQGQGQTILTPSFKENTIIDLSKNPTSNTNNMSIVTNISNSNNTSIGNVNVMCRFRPISDKEREQSKGLCIESMDNHQVTVKNSNDLNVFRFSFDRIFNPKANQEEVFQVAAKPIIDSVLEGFNGTIFAYGQTSSGKTYTMMGDLESKDNQGIIPRMVKHVFNHIENSPSEYEYTVKLSMMEIYMERIKDLIQTDRVNLNIREDKNRGNFVEDLSEHYVSSEEEIMELVQIGANNRTTKFTNMNDFSSRSHTILMLLIKSTNIDDMSIKTGKLFLVDLAGSEKIAKTGATGLTLEEAKNINKSLTTLGMVINSLTDEKSSHVPYRESKVTRILQESLGGNSKTCLIITCSPSNSNDSETLSTLRFGTRAKTIENKPKINKEVSVVELRHEIEKLELLLYDSNIKNGQLSKILSMNNIPIPSEISFKNRSPVKINRGSFHKTTSSIDIEKDLFQFKDKKEGFFIDDIVPSQSQSQSQVKDKPLNNNKYFEDNQIIPNQTQQHNEKQALSLLQIENKQLSRRLLEADESIKRLKIENDEKQRSISDLFELKYRFEDIEADNVEKIEFLERKIKKLKFQIDENQTEKQGFPIEDSNVNDVQKLIFKIVSCVSETYPIFEYHSQDFLNDILSLIEKYKSKNVIKNMIIANETNENQLEVLENNELNQERLKNDCLSKLIKSKEEQIHIYESQILELKSKVDFYESELSLENKNYIKKIEALEISLHQVDKLYHQVLTQKSVLKIENDVLSMLVSKKNDHISKLDKQIDVYYKDNIEREKEKEKGDEKKESFKEKDKEREKERERPINYVKGHKKSLNHNVVKVLKGGRGSNLTRTGNVSHLESQDKSLIEVIIDEEKVKK